MKKRHIGPLPGKAEEYLNMLKKLLRFVEKRNPSQIELIELFQKDFSLKSKAYVKDCIKTIENLGLITTTDDSLALTDKAKEYLKTNDRKLLYEDLDKTYVAVYDILELLHEKPFTAEQITPHLEKKTGEKWQTRTQYSRRLSWLIGLGYVSKAGQYYCLTEEGRNFVEGKKGTGKGHPLHDEIRDRLVETGKLFGYIGEREYKADGYVLDVVWKEMEEGSPTFVFEVLFEGNLSDALARLKYSRRKFGADLFLITDQKHVAEANNVIRTTFPEIARATSVMEWRDVDEIKENWIRFCGTITGKTKLTSGEFLRRARARHTFRLQ